MLYENMPLYPGMRREDAERPPEGCLRVPLFDGGGHRCHRAPPVCERVTLENPCRPGECAEILLGVDECGSLVLCVRRERRGPGLPCDPCEGRGGGFRWPERCDRPVRSGCCERPPRFDRCLPRGESCCPERR